MRTFGHRSRTPHGVRELKLRCLWVLVLFLLRRTPHGVRELKLGYVLGEALYSESHPTRGA